MQHKKYVIVLQHEKYALSSYLRFCVQLRKALAVSSNTSKSITDSMLRQMFKGLQGDTTNSTLLMLPSWLPSLPSGEESGAVLAVDFGGTSFRVMQVILGTDVGDVVRLLPLCRNVGVHKNDFAVAVLLALRYCALARVGWKCTSNACANPRHALAQSMGPHATHTSTRTTPTCVASKPAPIGPSYIRELNVHQSD